MSVINVLVSFTLCITLSFIAPAGTAREKSAAPTDTATASSLPTQTIRSANLPGKTSPTQAIPTKPSQIATAKVNAAKAANTSLTHASTISAPKLGTRTNTSAAESGLTHTNSSVAKSGLTHTNAAGTPAAMPETLSDFIRKIKSPGHRNHRGHKTANKRHGTHRMLRTVGGITTDAPQTTQSTRSLKAKKSPKYRQPRQSARSTQSKHPLLSTPTRTLLAKAALPAIQSPVSAQAAPPLTRETPAVAPQDEPTVGPQYYTNSDPSGHIRNVQFTTDSAGNINITGTADDTDKPFGYDSTWIMARLCPTSTGTPHISGTTIPSECSDVELYTNGHASGETGTFTFGPGRWGIFYSAAGSAANTSIDHSHSITPNDFKEGPGSYNIWLFRRDRFYQNLTTPVAAITDYYPPFAPSSVTLRYDMSGMPGASTPGNATVDTTYGAGSTTLAGEPSHLYWQIFDGWYLNYSSYNAGQSVSFAKGTNATYTVTPRWHTRSDTVTIHYQDNGSGCTMPGNQTADSANYSSLILAGTPSCPAHTAFDGWTINYANYDPYGTFNFTQHVTATYTATARTHTVQAPTSLTAAYHITGTVTLSGTSNVVSGDKITACMTEGTGDTACQSSSAAPANNSAWNWTVTFPSTDYTTRYGYGHQHHFTTKLTSKGVDSTTADLKGTLPWMTVTYDKGTGTGTAPTDEDALVDTAAGKATIAVPAQSDMTAPTGSWFEGWKNPDGTLTWQAGSAAIPTNASGATTDANGHTTLTLTARWHTVPAPTGVTARYSHADGYVYLTATGLQAGVTGWQIQVKPNTDNHYYQAAYNTSTTGQSYYYGSSFRPGATWTAQARATYTDASGNSVTSDWSSEYTGILPYMDVTLKPGSQQTPGGDTHAKGLTDLTERKAYVTLPTGVGAKPAGMDFEKWTTNPDGTGDTYQVDTDIPIPTASGNPGSEPGQTLYTLYARWTYTGQPPQPGHCADSPGWSQWGTAATQPAIPGIDGQVTGSPCYAIVDNGTTLRLTGGTSPDFSSAADIPWNGQKTNFTKISIEGDLTLTSSTPRPYYTSPISGPFNNAYYLTSFETNGHKFVLDRSAGNGLFTQDNRLPSIDVSNWDVHTAVNMDKIFSFDSGLEQIKGINKWRTSNVTTMYEMFYYCTHLTSVDPSNWDTGKLEDAMAAFRGDDQLADLDLSSWNTTKTWGDGELLPGNLQRLRLGPQTKFDSSAFSEIGDSHPDAHWNEWDWPKDHYPSDLGPVGATAGTSGDGTLNTLKTRAASAHPEGVYIRDDVTPTWTDLTYDLNGGTGDASLFTQPGAAAAGSTPKRDGLAIDTTFKDGEYTIPDGTTDTGNAAHHITGNKPQNLFQGWTIDTGNVTANASGGTATVSNHTITASKGAGGTATITAQWTPAPQAMPGTPAVSVTPNTTDQGGVSVSVSATLDQAMPAIEAGNGDPAKPAVSAGGTVKICAKPASQSYDYGGVQCRSKASTSGGSQTITPEALELPGSARLHSNMASFPTFGQQYTMAATYTLTDPVTRNQIEAPTTQSGGGSVNGTLAWLNASFDTNDAHGGNGTAPASLSSFVDTASNKAWIALPNATNTMKPSHFVFAGWSATASAIQPDTGMGDPANRNVQLPATTGATETQTVLYAVWHKLTVPTVTSLKRDVFHNRVIITGTAAPWTRDDDMYVEINPLDGQAGFTPGYLNTRISVADGQGHALPYDGHTAHPWQAIIPEDQMPAGGRFRTRTMLRALDHAWRDTHAGTYVYSDWELRANPPIAGHYQHSLPLTGGQRTQLIVALVLVGVMLIAGSQFVRNRRRWHHQ
ncbi:BspA family leucine-rich repeat surface protein [Bifidobacterium sp. ESL0690]|uniref:BspA family leucine-rich repeat surface protein n=1 Tax=Bifidobacterium sp. ESL0690 TaxID=2983214 RepID=UPI0023F7E975|nr:BspA family leucine-rich repeat surface protein [Bifidobacterium sp. ESL0690]WEV46725.1 BspA family leucine-rich repeat surface protein [Bifidobacterium sp. ESL0690]